MTTIIEAEHPYSYIDDDGSNISFKKGERFILVNKSSNDWWKVQRTGLYTGKSVCYVPASYVKEIIHNDTTFNQYVNLDVYQKIISKDLDGLSKLKKPMVKMKQSNEIVSTSGFDQPDNAEYEELDEELCDNAFDEGSDHVVPGSDIPRKLNTSYDQEVSPTSPLSFEISPRHNRMQSFTLPSGWKRGQDSSSGRAFYFNEKEHQRGWKPPRHNTISQSSSADKLSSFKEMNITVPEGWSVSREDNCKDVIYVNNNTKQRWKSCVDKDENMYYYNLDGEETTWELPVEQSEKRKPRALRRKSFDESLESVIRRQTGDNQMLRNSKCRSVLIRSPSSLSSEEERKSPAVSPRNLNKKDTVPSHERSGSNLSTDSLDLSFEEINMKHIKIPDKEGPLFRRRVVEGGKPIKKPFWLQLYCCKFGSVLVFYKDQKSANPKGGFSIGKPESSLDLRGSKLGHVPKEKAKGKKYVFQIASYGETTVQQFIADNEIDMAQWITEIQTTIKKLEVEEPLPLLPVMAEEGEKPSIQVSPMSAGGRPTSPTIPRNLQSNDKEKGFRGFSKRRLSKKVQNNTADDENKTKIRNKLKKYLGRRPSFSDLEEQGIIKDYVFGCPLIKLCEREDSLVPHIIVKIIHEVEKRGLEVDGIYRVSGNLSIVQKLRVKVDHGEEINFGDPQWNDIHVLSGTLKLYFRELPEPLFPFNMYHRFINIIKNPFKPDRISKLKAAFKELPAENRETLQLLITHLKRVMEKSSLNRMQSQNLAIIFGPTLLGPPSNDISNVAMTTIYQNQIVELFLTECNELFPGM